MDLRKLKTISILVLLIINFSLCSFILSMKSQDNGVDKSTSEQIVNLLSSNNISIDPKIIPTSLRKMKSCYISRVINGDEVFIAHMLGGVYSKADENTYINDNKTLSFGGDVFNFSDTNPKSPVTDKSRNGIENYCITAMQYMGISVDQYSFKSVNQAGEITKVIFTSKYDSYEFFDSYITFSLSDNGITSIQGKNLISENIVLNTRYTPFSISSILIDFINNPKIDKSQITGIVDISIGYYIGYHTENYKNVLSIPVWRILTQNGDIFYYDARNGNYIYI